MKIHLCNEKTLLPSTFFQNIPMKMEEPLCIAKCQLQTLQSGLGGFQEIWAVRAYFNIK